jgi:GMP synthase-like glutamine amidotransferase
LTRKILSVQNTECETLGILESLFLADKYQIQNVDAKEIPNHLNPESYRAIIILGGPMSVYDNFEYLKIEMTLIKNAVIYNVPVLGICLGSQLIASALGGRVYKGDHKEIGWYNIQLSNDGLNEIFNGIDNSNVEVFQWHGDTFDLPSDGKILAFNRQYIQAFKIGTAIGIQFHLEVTEDMINNWFIQYKEEIQTEQIKPEKIFCDLDMKSQNLMKNCHTFYSNFRLFIEQCDRIRTLAPDTGGKI